MTPLHSVRLLQIAAALHWLHRLKCALIVVMPKTKQKTVKITKKHASTGDKDSAYVLKLVLYLIIGSQWLRISRGSQWQVPIPYGAIVALFFAGHEHFKIDRKIEYAVIILAMFVGFWIPPGLSFIM